jgi:hypothetical protein
VLVITTTQKRSQNLRKVIAALTSKIFWVTTFDEIKAYSFWSAIWLRPEGEEKHSIVNP